MKNKIITVMLFMSVVLVFSACRGGSEGELVEDEKIVKVKEEVGDGKGDPKGSLSDDDDDADLGDAQLKEYVLYKDFDGDRYGDKQLAKTFSLLNLSEAPEGYVQDSTDCNDQEKRSYPGSLINENLDGKVDFNCDGVYFYLAGQSSQIDVYKNSYINRSWDIKTSTITSKQVELSKLDLIPTPWEKIVEIQYNGEGNIVRSLSSRRTFSGDRYIQNLEEYYYDEAGHLDGMIGSADIDGDGNFNITISKKYFYEGGRLLGHKRYIGDYRDLKELADINEGMDSMEQDKVKQSEANEYDDSGKMISKSFKRHAGYSVTETRNYEYYYDEKGLLMQESSEVWAAGTTEPLRYSGTIDYSYTDSGLVLKTVSTKAVLGSDLKLIDETRYNYDEKGFLINRVASIINSDDGSVSYSSENTYKAYEAIRAPVDFKQ